MPLEKALNINS